MQIGGKFFGGLGFGCGHGAKRRADAWAGFGASLRDAGILGEHSQGSTLGYFLVLPTGDRGDAKGLEFRVKLEESIPPGLKPAPILLALCGG